MLLSVLKSYRTQHLSRLISTVSSSARETQDVLILDRLLNVVRARSEPAFRSAVPMRSPILWQESLARAKQPAPPLSLPSTNEALTLTPRRMHDSYTQVRLSFASQPDLVEQYTNASGGIRTGKLMELLDSLAGSIAYKHVLGQEHDKPGVIAQSGVYLVTAAVDRLDMLGAITPGQIDDIRLSGHVIYVGNSSMEVAVKMESINPHTKDERTLMIGRFSMVCRDAHTTKARKVNQLVLETQEEKSLFSLGEMYKERKRAQSLRSLHRVPPSADEAALVHDLYLKHKAKIDSEDSGIDVVPMRKTKLESVTLMHPQERNIHAKVFGGYLMRLAYELGYTNATLFTGRPLTFLSLDSTVFSHPVPIGSVLRLSSHISHTMSDDDFSTLINVRVRASSIDVASSTENETNEFFFTWGRNDGVPLTRTVLPVSYPETIRWLEGRRALELGAQIRSLRK